MLLELVMIVKNSGEILRTCLQQNKPYIDYWTIVDTGSTDNTPDIIREELRDVPGQLHFVEFTTFAETRNKAFELAKKKCKYMIVLDDSYEIGNPVELRNYLQNSNADAIFINIGYSSNGTLTDFYYSTRITKSTAGLKYKYRIHEIIDIPKKKKSEFIDKKHSFIYDHSVEEHKNRSHARHKKDIELLLLEHRDLPKEPRMVYYLAVTSKSLGNAEDVVMYCKKLLEMTNIKEYTFYAEMNLVSQEYYKTGDTSKYELSLLDMQKRYMDRAEHSYSLAASLYKNGNLKQLDKIMNNLIKFPMPQLGLTILNFETYQYSIPYLYIEIKLKLGKVEDGVVVLKQMLEMYPNDQKLLNMKYAICDNLDKGHIRLAPKTMAIHTGKLPFTWDPKNVNQTVSGSEFMAMFLAKEFRDLGYRVFIFGSFEDSKNDYQTSVDGIQYIDTTYFSEFCLTYVIDNLIVSRYLENLVYYDNIRSVYLWVHDVVPHGDLQYLQMHKDKFKGFICVSEWQKRNIISNLGIDEKMIYVSRNAIHPLRFRKEVERTPYRFIYTSDFSRGVDDFVKMMPWIKEKYPLSTFHLFGKLAQIDEETHAYLKTLDYVSISPRVSQEQLAIEMMKSDVWLYPSHFFETYCISAVEAMAAGCLVAAPALGALEEIVADRGVLVPHDEDRGKLTRNLFNELCRVLDDPKMKMEMTERGREWALRQDFYTLALDWKKKLLS